MHRRGGDDDAHDGSTRAVPQPHRRRLAEPPRVSSSPGSLDSVRRSRVCLDAGYGRFRCFFGPRGMVEKKV